MLSRHALSCLLPLAFFLAISSEARADACSDLAALQLPGATITAAVSVSAGTFVPPPQVGYGSAPITVPAFCRVQLTLSPQALTEVWLPAAWNGRFQGAGNGGQTGAIIYNSLSYAINGGYAGVSSDLGHQSNGVDSSWALNRPDLLEQFGHQITHAMTVAGKSLVQAYYGVPPAYSYFYGASAGGRQALMEAQRYPDDYDGIAAIAPAQGWTHINAGMIAQGLALNATAGSQISAAQASALNKAVVAACDTLDGLKDGIINDPSKCSYDPVALACPASGGSSTCLSSAQVTSVRKLYQPLNNSAGALVYPGLPYGSEYEWSCSVLGNTFNLPFATSFFQNAVFSNPSWDYKTFNVDVDVPYADALLANTLNAWSPDMDAYKARGGKLLMAQGQADAIVLPQYVIDYYLKVMARYGGATQSFARLFMMPGSGHCGSPAPGPGNFDPVVQLVQWVENGIAPDSIAAARVTAMGTLSMIRPLCPYPQQAIYDGSGSISVARNFHCGVVP